MVGTIRNNYYFCTVKLTERHEVAAEEQHFLCPQNLVLNNKRKEWGIGNNPVVLAQLNQTAPTALSLLSN